MPASCVLFCSIPLSELVGRVKPPRGRLHSPAVRASIEGLSPLRRIASQTSAPQCGLPLRGSRPYGGLLRKPPPTPMGGANGKAFGLGEWAGGSRNARQRILFFKSLSPNLGQKFWGVKRNFYLRPQSLLKSGKKIKNPPKQAYLKEFQVFYAAERGKKER